MLDERATPPAATPEAPTSPITPAPAGGGPAFFAPLRLANYRLLIAGQTVSRFGDAFYSIALPWLVLRSVSSPLALALVLGVSAAALGAFNLIGGILADRHGPRILMLGADIIRFLLITGLAIWGLLATPPLWAIITITAVFGAASGLFYPAAITMTPYLVPRDDLQAANSFDQLTMQLANFLGPSIAGAVLSATRLAFGFVADAISFAVSVVSLLAIRLPAQRQSSDAAQLAADRSVSGLAALREALASLGRTPLLANLVGVSLLGNFAINGLLEVALPLLLKREVGLIEGPRAMGFIIAGFGLGSIIGAILAGVAARLPRKQLFAIISILPGAALFAAIPYVGGVLPITLIFVTAGLLLGFSNVLIITVIQRLIPIEMMGRMMSILLFGSFVGTPLSIAAYGLLATILPDLSLLFIIGAGLFAAACLIALSRKAIRQSA